MGYPVRVTISFMLALALIATSCSATSQITSDDLVSASEAVPQSPPSPAPTIEPPTPTAAGDEDAPVATPTPNPTSTPVPASPAPEPATDPNASASRGGVIRGVIDVDVADVLPETVDRDLFLSPLMQERLDQLVRPDDLVDPHPSYAQNIGGLRRANDASYGGTDPDGPYVDVRFLDWANLITEDATLATITQSYAEIAETINGVPVTVEQRDGSSNWIIEARGQAGPHDVTVDTQRASGGTYGVGNLVTTRFRFAHDYQALSAPTMLDAMPDWVREEIAVLEPLMTAGLGIDNWSASVMPDWASGEPLESRGRMVIIVDLGTTSWVSGDEPPDANVFEAMRAFGADLHVALGAPEGTWSPETDTSGSFNYRIDELDRDVRLFIAAGPSALNSFLTLEIVESEIAF